MSALATLGATGLSLAALGYLAATDPKRRRAFRLPPPGRRRAGAAWAVALLPGVLLPVASGAAGFFIWLGATSVAGWALAAAAPGRTIVLQQRLLALRASFEAAATAAARVWRRALARAPAFRRAQGEVTAAAELEHRIRRLEAELAELCRRLPPAEAPQPLTVADQVVIELARPGGRC